MLGNILVLMLWEVVVFCPGCVTPAGCFPFGFCVTVVFEPASVAAGVTEVFVADVGTEEFVDAGVASINKKREN